MTLLALALSLFRLGSPSLWMDEAYSVELARRPLSTLWLAYSGGGEANMILYHLLLHGWLNLLSLLGVPSLEFAVRLPSALFAAASAGVVFALGRHFSSRLAAGLAALLFLLNAYVLTAAQQTRAYSLQLLLVCLSWYLFLLALSATRRSWLWWGAYVLVTGAACYAQLSTVFIVFAQIVAFAILYFAPTSWRARVRSQVWSILASLIALGGIFAPIAIVSRGGSKTGWLPQPSLRDLPGLYIVYSFSKDRLPLLIGFALCGLAALILLVMWFRARPGTGRQRLEALVQRPQRGEVVFVITLICWLLLPALASFVVSQGATRVFSTRYLVIIVPALCLLFGVIASAIRVAPARAVLMAGLLIPALIGASNYYAHAQIEDWRTSTRWLEARYQPGDGLVSYNNVQGAQFAIQYYLHSDGSPADFDAATPGLVVWERLPGTDPFAGYQAALDPQALAAYGAQHTRIFFIAGRLSGADDVAAVQATTAWLDSHYHLVSQSTDGAASVRLYATQLPAPS
jgi:mannosyltransferase